MMTMHSFKSTMYVVVAGSIAPFLQKKQSAIFLPPCPQVGLKSFGVGEIRRYDKERVAACPHDGVQDIVRGGTPEYKAARMRKVIGVVLDYFAALKAADYVRSSDALLVHLFGGMERPFYVAV